jgi:hypothetical protein
VERHEAFGAHQVAEGSTYALAFTLAFALAFQSLASQLASGACDCAFMGP